MIGIRYCPIVGGKCGKSESEIETQKNTFFLAEPFKPDKDKKRRELAISNALKEALQEALLTKGTLKVVDRDPKNAIFCDICRMIQSSEYGIVDMTGSRPSVILELGMMLSLGKPTFVLVKKDEEKSLKEQIPSDILWKRAILYEEFIDIQEKLKGQVTNRPLAEPMAPTTEYMKEVVTDADPKLGHALNSKLREIKEELSNEFRELLEEVKLNASISLEKTPEVPASFERRINNLYDKVEKVEKLAGVPFDPELTFLRANWHYHRKELEKAVELYDWAIELKPNYGKAWLNKGVALGGLGRHEEAIQCYDKAIELNPDDEMAWYNKGNRLGDLGRHEEAIQCYDKAIELKPNYKKAIAAKRRLKKKKRKGSS